MGRDKLGASYVVNRSEIDAVFQGIALEFPVVVCDHFAVCVVDRDSLEVTILGLVSLFGRTLGA
jgi:hypothetical protein